MKAHVKILTLIITVMIGLNSCQDKIEDSYIVKTPVYMSYSDLRSSFLVKSAEEIIQPGKIYFKDNFIFVNEYLKGIHVIDNTDPSDPEVIRFIEIPGNIDMAVKGNILYADSYVDLLSIDISDMNNIAEVDRDTNVFPYIIPFIDNGILEPVDESQGIIVRYEETVKTEEVEQNDVNYQMYRGWNMELMEISDASGMNSPAVSGSGSGTGGSMARFTLYDDYLYTINNYDLKLFDVSDASDPVFTKDIFISWDIETLFPYENKLFIGGQSGMYVYNLTDPANPALICQFTHASACDPVVVEGDYAYVTLRGGNLCGAIESQLDVIDISDIEFPELMKSYPMEEPYGLGIDNDVLFVCDGNAGLKIYDATDKMKIDSNQVAVYSDINAFDVIPLGDVLVMIGTDGLYQYDYNNPDNIVELSHIPIYGNPVVE